MKKIFASRLWVSPWGSGLREAIPPPPREASRTKFKPWIPGTSYLLTTPLPWRCKTMCSKSWPQITAGLRLVAYNAICKCTGGSPRKHGRSSQPPPPLWAAPWCRGGRRGPSLSHQCCKSYPEIWEFTYMWINEGIVHSPPCPHSWCRQAPPAAPPRRPSTGHLGRGSNIYTQSTYSFLKIWIGYKFKIYPPGWETLTAAGVWGSNVAAL